MIKLFRRISFLIIIISSLSTSAQGRLDSLMQAYDSSNDSLKILTLLEMGDSSYLSDSQSAVEHYSRAMEMSNKNEFKYLEASASYALSIHYWQVGDFPSAYEYDKNCIKIYEELKDTMQLAHSWMGIGVTLSEMGLNEKAVIEYMKAKEVYEREGSYESLCSIYINLGAGYSDLGENHLAKENYTIALEIADSLDLSLEKGLLYDNLGSIHLDEENYKEACDYFERSIEFYKKEDYLIGLPSSYSDLGESCAHLGKFQEAEEVINRSIQMSTDMLFLQDLGRAYYSMAILKFKEGKQEEARLFLDKGKTIAKENDYIFLLKDVYELQSEIDEKDGRISDSFAAFKKFVALKDTLDKNNRIGKLEQTLTIQKNEQNQSELERLQGEQERRDLLDSRKSILLYGTLTIMVLLIIVGYIRFSSMKKITLKNRLLKEANSRLEKEKKLAEHASRMKADFLSTMSHELRTPMNAVIGTTNLLLMEEHSEGQRENLEILQFSSKNLLNLINDILDYNKLEAEKMELEEEQFNLKTLMENTAKSAVVQSKRKKLKISLDYPENLPAYVIGDETRLNQVLSNLVNNALKFTSEGAIALKVKILGQIDNKTHLEISVTDTGIGINEENLEIIFESFAQSEKFITRKFGGTGLGLSISRKLVDLMGGEIKVESEEGKGSTFSFDLILELGDELDYFESEKDFMKLQPGVDQLKKILVVDDNVINLTVTKNMLIQRGYNITVANSGFEAIEECAKTNFDVILMDLQMPKMDGFQTTEILLEKYSDLSIIALTAGSKEELEDKSKLDMFTSFLRKPVDYNTLIGVIENVKKMA